MLALFALVALALAALLETVAVATKRVPHDVERGRQGGRDGGGDGGAGETAPRVTDAGSTPLRKNQDQSSSVLTTRAAPLPKPPGTPSSGQATGVELSSVLATGWLSPLPSEPVREARRVAALVLILEGLRELLDPLRSGAGNGVGRGGVLLLPHAEGCWFHRDGRSCTCPVSGALEAERLLGRMPRYYARHVRGWFVDVERRGRWVWRKRRLVRERVVARRPGAELGPARAGLEWMARHWGLRDARGELVEPWLVAPGVDRLLAWR